MSQFAPKDGICWNCRRNIYSTYTLSRSNFNERMAGTEKTDRQIPYESKGRQRGDCITGCPHCHRSFVD